MPSRQIGEVIRRRKQSLPLASLATTVQDAAKLMKKNHSSAVMIVDEGILVGICTERDIVFRVVAENADPAKTKMDKVMTRKVQTIGPEKPFGHALHLMYEGGFRHIPVVDQAGHPLGLLAAHDALDSDGLQLVQELVRREEITVIL